MKILLLEDEKMLRTSIKEFLEGEGHRVSEAGNGLEAKNIICEGQFDLLLLDINVPEMNGFDLLEELKNCKIFVPTIFISALVDIEDITHGFSLGCADYIKKPFHLKELGLRIENIMKMSAEKKQSHIVLSKNYSFDTESNTVYFMGEPQNMTRRQLQIISVLAANLGHIVDFDKFREMVWDNGLIDNATIRAEINRLKKALKEDFVRNSRGLGYVVEKI